MCNNELWAPMTLLPHVLLGPLFVGNPCILGTPHKTCGFADVLTQWSPYHNVDLVNIPSDSSACPFFLLLTQSTDHLLPNISVPLTGATVTITSENQFKVLADQCKGAGNSYTFSMRLEL